MKKRNEKIVSTSLLAIIVVLMGISVAAAVPWEGYLVPQHSTVNYGEDTAVELWVEYDDTGLTYGAVAYQVDIHFDPSCVNITDTDFSTSPFNINAFTPYALDVVRIGGNNYGLGAISSGTYKMATLSLHGNCSESCTCDILFDTNFVSDTDMAPITNTYTNGTVTNEAAPGIADHVVISEVQISGATATDEFVELYNPTNAPVSLDDWYLTKKTLGGTNEHHLLAGFPDMSIPAHGFFLITHQSGYTGPVTADATYSTTNSIAADNTVILYSDTKITVVDKVGFGAALDNETLSYPDNPGDDESLQRKINATIEGDGYGPAWDTGNNSADFFIRTSNPRNSASDPVEPIPELSTLMLLTTGLVALVGYVIVKKGRKG